MCNKSFSYTKYNDFFYAAVCFLLSIIPELQTDNKVLLVSYNITTEYVKNNLNVVTVCVTEVEKTSA